MKQLKNEPSKSQRLREKTEDVVMRVGLVTMIVTCASVVVVRAIGFYMIDKIKGK